MDIALITDNLLKSQAFKLKGRLYTLTVLCVLDADENNFGAYLTEVIAKAPRMFEKTPVILDFSEVQHDSIDLQRLCFQLRERGIIPVAVQGADASLQISATANGLALIGASSGSSSRACEGSSDFSTMPSAGDDHNVVSGRESLPEAYQSKMITTPIRSGQQIVAKGGELVVIASVGHGAELLSSGNIHVYGALRGRALAGIDGNKQARIFCNLLDAELVSIAGFYRLRDAIEPPPGPCQIFLKNDHIVIEAI